MKHFLFLILIVPAVLAAPDGIRAAQRTDGMKIKIRFDGGEVLVRMYDNAAAREVIALLPASFEFSDFAGQEKIASFSRPLSLRDAPRGTVPQAGEMFIFVPWGNMGIFYKTHGQDTDYNLIPLGKVETGLETLARAGRNFTAALEISD